MSMLMAPSHDRDGRHSDTPSKSVDATLKADRDSSTGHLASFVVYREWVKLAVIGAWHLVLRTSLLYKRWTTSGTIFKISIIFIFLGNNVPNTLFLLFLTDVLIVSRSGLKRMLNAHNVNVNVTGLVFQRQLMVVRLA